MTFVRKNIACFEVIFRSSLATCEFCLSGAGALKRKPAVFKSLPGLLSPMVKSLAVYLAAAAYNAGAGRIEREIRRLPGEPDTVDDQTFFVIADRRNLRRETRDYVPKLIAAALIAKQPSRYGFTDIERLSPLVFDEVSIPDATGLDVLARLADTSVAALLELNPQFVRGITPPARAVVVRVPRGTGAHVAEGYADLPINERVTFVDHYVSAGQTLSSIAQRYKVTVGRFCD